MKLSERTAVGGQYFSCGDLIATTLLSEMLAVILLGQSNSQWTARLATGLRYSLDKASTGQRYELRDGKNAERSLHPPEWKSTSRASRS